VGELSAGIAHEIRAPVARVRCELDELRGRWAAIGEAVRGALESAPRHTVETGSGNPSLDDEAVEILAEGEELVDECLEGVDRITSIVADVAGLAEQSSAIREAVDVQDVLDRALRVALPREERGIVVDRRRHPVPRVMAIASQLEQVFVNLVRNAVHAVAEAGRITVEAERAGQWVRVRVEDDGPGIAPEVRGRIFDPFFTTKPVGEGTGLGLAISYHIVENHGGQIRVESTPGQGASFIVELPAVDELSTQATDGVDTAATRRAAESSEVG
jgi:signal transduction histidine kinase